MHLIINCVTCENGTNQKFGHFALLTWFYSWEQLYINRLNTLWVVTFWSWKCCKTPFCISGRIWSLTQHWLKLYDWFCIIKKIKSSCQYHTNCKEEWVENCCEGELGIGKNPYQRKEKKIENQWVIMQKATTYVTQSDKRGLIAFP